MTFTGTFYEGPLNGEEVTMQDPAADYIETFPIPVADDTDGKAKIFVYEKSPYTNMLLLKAVHILEDSDTGPPEAAGLGAHVVTPDLGWIRQYGTHYTCINSNLVATALFDQPNDRIEFKIDASTAGCSAGQMVWHLFGSVSKAASCPNDPVLIAKIDKISGPLPLDGSVQAKRYHRISGFQGKNLPFFSQWICPTATIGTGSYSNGAQGILW